jgi:hypothetical protein
VEDCGRGKLVGMRMRVEAVKKFVRVILRIEPLKNSVDAPEKFPVGLKNFPRVLKDFLTVVKKFVKVLKKSPMVSLEDLKLLIYERNWWI